MEGARVWVEARLAPTWPSCPGTPSLVSEGTPREPAASWGSVAVIPASREAPWWRFVPGPWAHRLLGWEPHDGCCLGLPLAPKCARGSEECGPQSSPEPPQGPRSGLLGVQELNGHDHLSFALEEHHLRGGRRTNSQKLREQPRLAQDEVERSSMPPRFPSLQASTFPVRDHCWVLVSPARWCLWGWGHIQRSQEAVQALGSCGGRPPPPAGLVRGWSGWPLTLSSSVGPCAQPSTGSWSPGRRTQRGQFRRPLPSQFR